MGTYNSIADDTPVVWADTTDYSSTVSGYARTHQLDLTGVVAGAARQGAKADLGSPRADIYDVFVAIEAATAFVDEEVVSFWWAASPSATAGNANPGGTTGADAAYTGTAASTLDESLEQLVRIGSLRMANDATTVVQYSWVGRIIAPPRYGMPVVYNESAADNLVADAVEMYVALVPLLGNLP